MEMIVHVMMEVKIPTDRCNINEIFDAVLERLRYTALRHQIYICAYGTITYDLIKLPWLQIRDPAMSHDFKLSIFTSK